MERTRQSSSLSAVLPLLQWLLLMGLAAAVSTGNKESHVGFIGDSCKIKDGSSGVCRSIKKCNAAQEALKMGEQPTICSYDEFTPIVCCPDGTRAPGAKAAAMCAKYAESVYELVRNPLLDSSIKFIKKDNCAITDGTDLEGGVIASPDEFPHIAVLGYKDRDQPIWRCVGALISERYILTTAYCLHTADGPVVAVRLGLVDIPKDHEPNDQYEDYDVVERLPHPNYTHPAYYHDVGLLKLERDVKFTHSIRPACLNALTEIPEEDATVAGWGLLDLEESESTEKLMKLTLPLEPSEECLTAYDAPWPRLKEGFHGESMLCMGEPANSNGTCLDGSGGPLQTIMVNPYCMYSLIGFTNFGRACGQRDAPAVFSRISYYLPWIESIVFRSWS